MKEAGNAAIIAGLGREFGTAQPDVIFSEAQLVAGLPRHEGRAKADYRAYVTGGELLLPSYVQEAALKLLDLIPDSL